ncbi:MAG: hypothetical protein Q4Q06_06015, partial [Bacteroidota bacterium]|nr:hypothetical protein [Bacteroidota bacterium]
MFLEYSLWFLPLIILVAFALACWQYGIVLFKNKSSLYTKRQRNILFFLRFASIFLILFLFLSPIKRIKHKSIEKPTIVVAQDVSSSINKALSKTSNEYFKSLEELCKELKDNYNIIPLQFGNKVRSIDFKEKILCKDYATDFSDLYNHIAENYDGENLSSIILASDGISTQGESLLNTEEYFSCPVYTIALGDTTQKKDIQINNVRYNKICFLDNEFPLEISIKANKCKGEQAVLSINYNNKTSVIKQFYIDSEDFFL